MSRIRFMLLVLILSSSALFASDKLEKVSLQLHWKYQFEFAGFIAAKEKGFYKDAGLDVALKEYEYGMNIEEEVIGGKSNYGIYNSNILVSYLQSKPLRLLSSFFKRSALVIIAKPEIKTVKDLVGKRIMMTTREDFDFNFQYMLDKEGIDSKSIHSVKHSYGLKEFISGEVDGMTAFVSDMPHSLDMANIPYTILNPTDYGIYNLQLELFTSTSEARTHPKRTKAFRDATIKGWEYALAHQDEIIDIIYTKYSQRMSIDSLKYEAKITERLMLPDIYTVGSIDYMFLQRQVEIFQKDYNISSQIHLDNFIFDDTHTNISVDVKTNKKIEMEYIKNKKYINVCTNPNWTPIEFLEGDKPVGISIDTLSIIEKSIGIRFKFVKTSSWSESQKFLEQRKCDILPAAIETKKRLKYANFTKPYLRYDLAIVTKDDKPLTPDLDAVVDKSMSRKKGSGLISKLKAIYPDIHIVETAGYQEAFQSVSDGATYFTVATLPVLSYYKNRLNLDNLQIAGYTDMKYNLSIAVRKDDAILLGILNRAVAQIGSSTHNIIYEKWTNKKVEFRTDYSLVWRLLSIGSFFILLMSYYQIRTRRHNRELKGIKNELQLLNNSLEFRVQEELAKNKQQQVLMVQQSRLAQMGEMISMIAHQWRQPLAAISATSAAMSMKEQLGKLESEDIIKLSGKISEYSLHLSNTIDDFREFFRLDKERDEVTYSELVESILSIIEDSIISNGIIIEKHLHSTDRFYTYTGEVKQVILNLMKNAEDALLDKDIENPKITIETDGAMLTIRDNTGGVPEDILDKIFDPYFSTKTQKDGTGLGLYMSKTIIDEHCSGELRVANDDDGAVFTIVLATMSDEDR